jgi:hypothetical protein
MADIWFDVDAALSEVPVNIFPLTDDTDFKTRETAVAYNAAGMDLVWNFVTTAGAMSQTAVTPTTGGAYDWAHQGDGMYTIEIPASGGASINNDTEGFGWFTGMATGVLPWRSPVYGFRAAGINNKLIDDAYDTARGLAGTALPAAAADEAGGLPISDAGELDLDAIKLKTDALPSGIKKGVAINNFMIYMRSSTDHITGATGLTVSGQIAGDDGSFTALTGTITEVAYGLYRINTISASETNYDVFTLRFTATGADPAVYEFKTV